MKELFTAVVVVGIVILILFAAGTGVAKLIQMWRDLPEPPPATEQWIGICISSELNEEQYQKQYERADIEKLKTECQFRGLSRDILGCYGDDHYKFLCPVN